jgi:predicted ATPase
VNAETTLIGRDYELTRIEDALCAVEAGECRVLVVSGELGIGKSRLLSELGARASRRGLTRLT